MIGHDYINETKRIANPVQVQIKYLKQQNYELNNITKQKKNLISKMKKITGAERQYIKVPHINILN